MALVHHELCFGCGRVNLFGLLVEVEETAPGRVAGRCFVKQDHQGPDRGNAHEGIVAAALTEAMALACGLEARALGLEMSLSHGAPVGGFLDVEARVESRDGSLTDASATASVNQRVVATARGRFRS